MSEYTVHRHKFGRYVTGAVPITDMVVIMKSYQSEAGKDAIMAVDLCPALGASLVLTTPDNHAAWREEVASEAKKKSSGDAQLEWLFGPNVGQSSLSIMAVLGTSGAGPASGRLSNSGPHPYRPTPLDNDDWGRCVRVMAVLRLNDLDGMKTVSPAWKHIAENIHLMVGKKEIQHVLEVANGIRR